MNQLCAAQVIAESVEVIVGDLCRAEDGRYVSCEGGGVALAEPPEAAPKAPEGRDEVRDLPADLKAKVARREPGKGGYVALTASEIEAVVANGTFGIVGCGANPRFADEVAAWNSEKEAARRDSIHRDLVAKGYVFTDGRGRYDGDETSILVLVPNADPSDLDEIGTKHRQDSVVYADRGRNQLRYTTGEKKGKRHEGRGFTRLDKDADNYFSEFFGSDKASFRFSLNLDFDALVEWYRRRYERIHAGFLSSRTALSPRSDALGRNVVGRGSA